MCVLRDCIPNKSLYPLRRESGYAHHAKGVTTKCAVTPFTYEQCLKAGRLFSCARRRGSDRMQPGLVGRGVLGYDHSVRFLVDRGWDLRYTVSGY